MAKKLVLLCDDTEETVELLKTSLEIAGYEILIARNGEEGLKQAQEHLPDLIILDIMMPKMDGFTVYTKLKENEKTKNIPVIISTIKGFMSKVFAFPPLKTEGDTFLEKPYSIEQLWSKVKQVLGE
ncbi:MAG: response regulator [Elusimicrobia bacterium]|nr:response regulator [Elusimicrobiota bacterium]